MYISVSVNICDEFNNKAWFTLVVIYWPTTSMHGLRLLCQVLFVARVQKLTYSSF